MKFQLKMSSHENTIVQVFDPAKPDTITVEMHIRFDAGNESEVQSLINKIRHYERVAKKNKIKNQKP